MPWLTDQQRMEPENQARCVSQFAQTALAKYRVGGLNNRRQFLTVLEAGMSTIKVLVGLVSGENLLPGE